MRISTQAPSISDSSVSESIGIAITWDPHLLVPSEVSLSSAPIAAAVKSGWPDDSDPTPEIQIDGTEESSQAATASLIFQHPQSIPAAIVPTEHDKPSCFVPELVVATDALRDTTSSATIPSIVNLIPRCSTSTIIVSDSPSSPIKLPLPFRGTMALEPPSPLETVSVQPNYIPHAPISPSSSPKTASSHISPQIAPALETQVASYIGTPSFHDCILHPNHFISLPHLDLTATPAHDAATSLQHEDQV